MKTKLGVLIFLMAAVFARASTLRSNAATEDGQTNNLTALLQKGLFEEQANRNLNAAIADYQSLAAKFDQDRKLAATAVFRLGECYRMQGKTNEAAVQYQRVLREFPDEKTLVTLSRQNLTALGATPSTETSSDNSGAQLWNRVKNLPEDQLEKVLPILVPDPVLTSLLQQRNEGETKLAELRNYNGPQNIEVVSQKSVLAAINKQISEKIQGIMQALKLRAELSQTTVRTSAPTDAEDREIQRIQQMIQNSPDLINAPSPEYAGGTPLIGAAYAGELKVAAYLLDHGADVNASCSDVKLSSDLAPAGKVTPLLAAVAAGNRAMAEFLISHGANVNFKDGKGDTPLALAAGKGFQAVTEVLLASHVDVNAHDNSGNTPLELAVEKGRPQIVHTLLAAGANPNLMNKDGDTPLSAAVHPGLVPQETRVEIVKLLLGADAKPNATNRDGRTPLSYAANGNWNRRPEIVKLLLTAKANPNGGKLDAPLLSAIHNRDVESAKLLLLAGANANAKGEVVWLPSWNWHRVQLVPGGNFQNRGSATPLWLAVDTKQLPMVNMLLKFKANPNDTQTDGNSLLFDTLSHTNILKALLDAGANPNKRVEQGNPSLPVGRSPLEQAIFDGKPVSVALLLAHGAEVNSADKREGMTPLLWAANRGASTNIVELLLHAGANVNAKDKQGNTPLHDAAENGYGQIVALLLAHKADPNVRDNFGRTPLGIVKSQIARRQNQGPQSAMNFIRPPGTPSSHAPTTPPQEIEKMLLARGALEHLPHWNRIQVSRPGDDKFATVFRRSTNNWNHFTLLETVLDYYENDSARGGYTLDKWTRYPSNPNIPFPNLAKVVILRPRHDSTNITRIKIDLLNNTNGIDCSKDAPLKFGDVVEIPEREHTLAEADTSGPAWIAQISDCLRSNAGTVKLIVAGGQTIQVQLDQFGPLDHGIGEVLNCSQAQSVLTSDSDFSRVQVVRRDVKTGKTNEWVLNCSRQQPQNEPSGITFTARLQGVIRPNVRHDASSLWLRNGDVIEVPEKP